MSTYERPELLEPGRQPTYEREVERGPSRPEEREKTAQMIAGGSAGGAIAGLAAAVLAIIGLANVAPMYMVCIAAIVAGAAILMQGGVIAAREMSSLREGETARIATPETGGMTAEAAGGIAAIVLGILALIEISPLILLPVASIVLGASLLFSAGAVDQFLANPAGREFSSRAAGPALVGMGSGAQVMVGLAAIVLGILGVVGFAPLTLTLVAMLCVGTAVLMTGAALGGKLMSAFSRR